MPSLTIDEKKYGRLLARHVPAVIESDEEQDHFTELLLRMTAKEDSLSPEERRLVDLLERLIEDYEIRQRAANPRPKATPVEMLEALMEMGNLRQSDLADVFGSQSVVSRVLSGEREINLNQARRLAARFRMPIEKFL